MSMGAEVAYACARTGVAIALLLGGSPVAATTGGADALAHLCFDAGDNVVRWVVGEPNGGYAAHELSVSGDEHRVFATSENLDARLSGADELRAQRCVPLRNAVDLAATFEGVAAPTGEVRADFQGPDGLVRPLGAVQRPRCSYEITLSRAEETVARVTAAPCCGATDVHVIGAPLPTAGELVLVLRYVGKCFESGYETYEVAVVHGVATDRAQLVRADRSGRLPVDDAGRVRGELVVNVPPFAIDLSRLLGDAGFRAYQQGSYAVAIEYFESAYEKSRESIPDLEALFNLAATQSKAGDAEAALVSLRRLMSFDGQRARFLARVESDSDFDPLRSNPVFREVLVPASCCQWMETEENEIECWFDHCPRGGLHSETETLYAFRRGERRIVEQSIRVGGELRQLRHDDGDFVSKYASGEDRERGTYVDGLREGEWMLWTRTGARVSQVSYQRDEKHGVEREWYPSGPLRAERNWRDGVLHGRAVEWYETGAKRSEVSYSAGQRHGPFSRWYETGDKELHGRWDLGRADGLWSTWSPEDGSVVQAEVHEAGVLRFRCEYVFFEGEVHDTRRCTGTYFHDNGKPAASGLVLEGQPTGSWQHYSSAGVRQRNTAAPDDRPLSRERSAPPPEPR